MSVQAMTWAFAQDLPAKPKVVLLALANRADSETGKCWPGLERLAKESSVPQRSLIRHIHALVRNGYVVKEKSRATNGRQRNNTYYLVIDRDAVAFGQWQWFSAKDDADEGEHDNASLSPDDLDTQDDGPRGATMASRSDVDNCGVPSATSGTEPSAIGGTREPSSEPKLKTESAETRSAKIGFSRKAQDADIDQTRLAQLAERSMVREFVLKDSRAWKAWCEYRRRHGQVPSLPETWITIDGKRRCGWHMPTLFPPADAEAKRVADEEVETEPS